MQLDIELTTLLVVVIAMGLGGLIKGLSAFGLPFITIPILAQIFPVPTAIALTALPILTTNTYQMIHGGHLRAVVGRLWLMIVPLAVCLFFSIKLLVSTADSALIAVVGLVILVYVTMAQAGFEFSLKRSQDKWVAPLVGASSGVIGGLTSFYGMPAFFYIATLRLTKEQFICAVATTLLSGGIVMTVQLSNLDILNQKELILSTIGLLPLFLGLFVGQKLRNKINQGKFQQLVRIVLGLMGVSMIVRGILA